MSALFSLPLAASEGAASDDNPLLATEVGLMIWTLLVFGVSMFILWKLAFPLISGALERRQTMIEDSIDSAAKTRAEADELLAEYRERLKEARAQADEIVARAAKAGSETERLALEESKQTRIDMVEQAKRDIEAETRKAIQDLRREVAGMTVAAAEHVTRKSLTAEDQERLVEEALAELDFEALGGRN
jgi:F-type H+-transporting ATPase subunit b